MTEFNVRTDSARSILLAVAIFLLLLSLEICIAIVIMGDMPTGIFLFPFRHFSFYQSLWGTSAWEVLRLLLVDKAILVVEYKSAVNNIQVWGLFYYALNLLLHGAVVLLAGIGWFAGRFRKAGMPLGLFILGSVLLIFASSYVQLAYCCGSGPGWLVEVWLLARAYEPLSAPVWQELYQSAQPLLLFIQVMVGTIGLTMLLLGWTLSRKKVWNR